MLGKHDAGLQVLNDMVGCHDSQVPTDGAEVGVPSMASSSTDGVQVVQQAAPADAVDCSTCTVFRKAFKSPLASSVTGARVNL